MKDKFNNAVGPQTQAGKGGNQYRCIGVDVVVFNGWIGHCNAVFCASIPLSASVGYEPEWRVCALGHRSMGHRLVSSISQDLLKCDVIRRAGHRARFLIIAIGKVIRKNTANANQYLHGSADGPIKRSDCSRPHSWQNEQHRQPLCLRRWLGGQERQISLLETFRAGTHFDVCADAIG